MIARPDNTIILNDCFFTPVVTHGCVDQFVS